MKRAIVLSGVSGVGKTHLRQTHPDLKDLPCVDIADIYRANPEYDWMDAYTALAMRVRALFIKHDTVVVEGYFLPGSRTAQLLGNDLRIMGATPQVFHLWAPLRECVDRIRAQWERSEISDKECKRRIELLKDTWTPYT